MNGEVGELKAENMGEEKSNRAGWFPFKVRIANFIGIGSSIILGNHTLLQLVHHSTH